MFRFQGFTQKANMAINIAVTEAQKLGHDYIGVEHLLLGLSATDSGISSQIFSKFGVYFTNVRNALIETYGKEDVHTNLVPDDFTAASKRALEQAIILSRQNGSNVVTSEDMLIAILKQNDRNCNRMLKDCGLDSGALISETLNLQNAISKEKKTTHTQSKSRVNTPNIDKYCSDLTELAERGEFDPIIGREKEIDQLIEVLSRKTKNNPCLVGEAGVGKTAVVEGLAQRIVAGSVPQKIANKRVLSLDVSSMVAGAKYRGDFEERINKVIKEVISDESALLFVDEVHNVMGAGSADGALDAANILKPHLARGAFQIIGATTFDEYRKRIEKDSALERRFQKVTVDPPTVEQAISIMKGIKSSYEKFHDIIISDDAVESAVTLSDRYVADRQLPDKAIDILDTASARLQLKANDSDEVQTLTKENIVNVISDLTGIDINALSKEQHENLTNLEDTLSKKVIGQDAAIKLVANAVRRGKVGLKDPNRPIGSFAFFGSTGVGKTELCLALSEALFQSRDAVIRMDMSEYMEKHSVSKLIGAPAGYVGYDDGGQLTEKIRRKPYSVVLFDEIEKAHPDVLNILLQIIEDGMLKDAKGVRVSFKNTIIIMTSNVGAENFTKKNTSIGFGSKEENSTKTNVMVDVKNLFRPEFLNRIDDIIVFERLTKENVNQIAQNMLEKLAQKAAGIGITVSFSDEAVEQLVEEGYDKDYGARPLRRVIQKKVEDLLAAEILNENIKDGDTVVLEFSNEFTFGKKELATI